MAERRVDCKQRLGFRKGATSHTHHCETSPVEAFGVRWQSEAATALWLGDPLSKAASRCACRRSPHRRAWCVCRAAPCDGCSPGSLEYHDRSRRREEADGPCFHDFRLLTSAAADRGVLKLMLSNGGLETLRRGV